MATYGGFCPVAKAAEVLCQRWAILIVREVLSGSRRFRDIQRGMPGCPPATLSKRLRELEAAGVVRRDRHGTEIHYDPTPAGWELYPVIEGLGQWGQRWRRGGYGPDDLDAEMLLWDVRRFLDPDGLGVERAVVEVDLHGVPGPGRRRFWMVVEPGSVDLCTTDPQRPVDALLTADLRSLTRVWMGDLPLSAALANGDIAASGSARLADRLPAWLGRHPILADVAPVTADGTDGTAAGAAARPAAGADLLAG